MRHLAARSFSAFFVLAGINHFVMPEFYLRIIPPQLPAHDLLNALAGLAEIGIGVLVALPQTRRLGAWLAIALLIAVFPANIYLFNHQEIIPGVPPILHLLRLPLQGAFIYWAYRAGDLGSRRSQA